MEKCSQGPLVSGLAWLRNQLTMNFLPERQFQNIFDANEIYK